ncbi:putative G3BP-like protein [Eutrema salsugineum]|uniref:putative G3BP-like protein n=1 Tax=Eutrema salsugineum TaxID=72664 RepID=UPI000CED04E8|nr:putative G3BP-like protein [Eutrema salsugineum]
MSEEETNYAEIFSRAFVKQYYQTLNESPQFLHMFYSDYCLFNRLYPETHVKKTIWTKEEVKDEFLAVRFEDFTAEIETSLGVPYPMEHGYVIVYVKGYLTKKRDNVGNKFTQTFLLIQQDTGFCIVNDIFRYEIEQTQIQTCLKELRLEPEPVASSQPLPHDHELAATKTSVCLFQKSLCKGEVHDEWFMV